MPERGYAYSPDRTVESYHDLVGRGATDNGDARCTVSERGGGCHWYVAQSSLG